MSPCLLLSSSGLLGLASIALFIEAQVEPWLDTSTPDPDTIPTLPRHYPDTSTLRHQCQPTLGPTLRHQCQASVKPSRQWTSSTDVKQCQGCQDKIDTPTLDTSDTPDTPTLRHLHTHTRATSTRHGRPAGASWAPVSCAGCSCVCVQVSECRSVGGVGGVECRSVDFVLTPLTLLDVSRGGPLSRWLDTGLTLVSECRTECRLTLVSECRGVGVVSG